MKYETIVACRRRLASARHHLDSIKAAHWSEVERLHTNWYNFLDNLIAIPENLKTRTKSGPERGWFRDKLDIIERDDLLRYLYAARGASHHATDRSTAVIASGETELAYRGQGGWSGHDAETGEPVNHQGMGVLAGGQVKAGDTLDFQFLLRPAFNEKYKQETAIPTEHLGQQLLDAKATTVGELALRFYEIVVDEAEEYTS